MLCFGCEQKPDAPDDSENSIASSEWVVYDGEVPLDESRTLAIVLSLKQGTNVSEGEYQLTEFEKKENMQAELGKSKGTYAASFDTDTQAWIIRLQGAALENGVKRIYRPNPGTIREEIFRTRDLTLKKEDDDRLMVLDADEEPVSTEPGFNLIKRTSGLFTAEGYFVYKGNTAEFYEMNTHEKWTVSKRGAFYEAANQYHQLAKEKFESLYLKAVAFSIHSDAKKGNNRMLVFKRIIQTSSSPVIVE